jgi:hypothetical protein
VYLVHSFPSVHTNLDVVCVDHDYVAGHKEYEEERQYNVFVESNKKSKILTHVGQRESRPCPGPIVRLFPKPVLHAAWCPFFQDLLALYGTNYIIVPRGSKYGQKIFRGVLRVYIDLFLACENLSLLWVSQL